MPVEDTEHVGHKRKNTEPYSYVILKEECEALAGWTCYHKLTEHGRQYTVFTAPGSTVQVKSKLQALRIATGTVINNPTATAIGPYPSRRADALKAVKRGETHMHGRTPVVSMDPRRSYSGPHVPRFGLMPAGDDLPNWTIERMAAADGKEFLMYRDPCGLAVGSRGSALKAMGLLFVSRTEKTSMRYAEKQACERKQRLQDPVRVSDPCSTKILASREHETTRVFAPNEVQNIIKERFTPTMMAGRCASVLSNAAQDVRARVFVVDMFAGCGGFSLGLRGSGFPYVFGIDENPTCRASYKENCCGTESIEQRIRIADVEHWHTAFSTAGLIGPQACCELVMLAGCPCQPYSRNGQRAGISDERDCLGVAVELAKRIRPLVFVVENVIGMLDAEFGTTVKDTLDGLVQVGYTMCVGEHKCRNHGVPQSRERLLVVFTRNDRGDGTAYIPDGVRLRLARSLGERTTCVYPEDVICEPGFWSGKCPLDLQMDISGMRSRERIPGDKSCMAILSARVESPTLMTSSMRTGAYHRLVAVPNDKDPRTLLNGDLRMLHTRHGLQLQTFPPGFALYGNLAMHATQIGNAVPPMLAYDFGQGLRTLLGSVEGVMCWDTSSLAKSMTVLTSAISELMSP